MSQMLKASPVVDGITTFATFGEAFRAAMACSTFADPFYPCDACGKREQMHRLVRTPDGCASVHPRCLPRWGKEIIHG